MTRGSQNRFLSNSPLILNYTLKGLPFHMSFSCQVHHPVKARDEIFYYTWFPQKPLIISVAENSSWKYVSRLTSKCWNHESEKCCSLHNKKAVHIT